MTLGCVLYVHGCPRAWLRSPNFSNSNNVRHVNTDGSEAHYSSAYSGLYGLRPASVETATEYASRLKTEAHPSKESASCPTCPPAAARGG